MLATMAAEAGYGPTHLARLDSTLSVSIVSTPTFHSPCCAHFSLINNHHSNNLAVPEPRACGRPEQPPNSTMTVAAASTRNPNSVYEVGATVEYSCNAGSLLIGPATRTCLDTGFYNEFPPVCKSKETAKRASTIAPDIIIASTRGMMRSRMCVCVCF